MFTNTVEGTMNGAMLQEPFRSVARFLQSDIHHSSHLREMLKLQKTGFNR
jgi:hypothetical protein